jgi:hypothetical protein
VSTETLKLVFDSASRPLAGFENHWSSGYFGRKPMHHVAEVRDCDLLDDMRFAAARRMRPNPKESTNCAADHGKWLILQFAVARPG